MTSPPLTNREYAYFHVSGPGTHEQITEILGLKPSEAWNVGDTNPQSGKPCKFMSWRLSSALNDTQPLDLHIQNLFLFLHPKVDALRRLWVEYDLTPKGHHLAEALVALERWGATYMKTPCV